MTSMNRLFQLKFLGTEKLVRTFCTNSWYSYLKIISIKPNAAYFTQTRHLTPMSSPAWLIRSNPPVSVAIPQVVTMWSHLKQHIKIISNWSSLCSLSYFLDPKVNNKHFLTQIFLLSRKLRWTIISYIKYCKVLVKYKTSAVIWSQLLYLF